MVTMTVEDDDNDTMFMTCSAGNVTGLTIKPFKPLNFYLITSGIRKFKRYIQSTPKPRKK